MNPLSDVVRNLQQAVRGVVDKAEDVNGAEVAKSPVNGTAAAVSVAAGAMAGTAAGVAVAAAIAAAAAAGASVLLSAIAVRTVYGPIRRKG